jgi:hypothetical protein
MILLLRLFLLLASIKCFCLCFEVKTIKTREKALESLSVALKTLSESKVSTILIVKFDKNGIEVDHILRSLKFVTVTITDSVQGKSSKNSLTLFWFRNETQVKRVTKKNFAEIDSPMFLLFCEDQIQLPVLSRLFEIISSLAIFDVNVLMLNDSNVVLVTFIPFRDKSCRNTTPVISNVFNESAGEWRDDIFPDKLGNFYECPLKISTLEYPPAVMKSFDGEFYGCDIEVIRGLSTAMNFTVDLAFVAAPYNFGEVYDNGSSGAVAHVVSGEADMLMGFYFLSYERIKFVSHSHP